MSKDLSANFYQNNKEGLQKNFPLKILVFEVFSKKKKKKNKGRLSIEKML